MNKASIYLMITPFFPTKDSFRGPFVLDQVKAIERTGRYQRVVVMRPCPIWAKQEDYEFDGVEVHYFPIVQMPSNLLLPLPDALNKRLFLKRLRQLGILPDDISVAHAHVGMNACFALAVKEKNPAVKTLLQHHDADPFGINMSRHLAECGWNSRINSRYLVRQYGKIDLHVAVSNKVEHNLREFPNAGKEEVFPRYLHLLEYVKGLRPATIKACTVLYNGVDTSLFYPETSKAKKGKFRIGCIGNYQVLKDHITLLKAVHRMKDKEVELLLVGSGETYEECQQYVAEHGMQDAVTFLREMRHEDLRSFYNSLDLFVLPSYFEGFGCVFTEAYACGVPFMSCTKQGVSEIVEEPEKWLIDKHDNETLARLISNYKLYRYEQKLNADYDINILVKHFLDVVERL